MGKILTSVALLILVVGLVVVIGSQFFEAYKTNVANEEYGTQYVSTQADILYVNTSQQAVAGLGITSSSVSAYNNTFLAFDGVDDRVGTGKSVSQLIGVQNFTISLWAYPSNTTGNFIGANSGLASLNFRMESSNLSFQYRNNTVSTTKSATSQHTILRNTWQHLVATYNGTDVILYRNGVSQVLPADDSIIWNNSQTIEIAFDNWNSNIYFNGDIDEVRIYDRTLSDSEITQIYNSGLIANSSLPSTGLVAWYSLNEGTGTTAYDKSGNGNTGTLVGFD